MPSTDPPPFYRAVRRARVVVALWFFLNGATFASLVPRLPELKSELEMSNAVYGVVIAAYPVGALALGLVTGALVRRFGSAKVAVAGMALAAVSVVLAGLAPSTVLFAAALFLAGGMDAVADVGQNAHGLRVQRRMRRSILNSLHGTWSIGAVFGSALATGAIALDVPRGVQLGVLGSVFAAAAILSLRFALPGHDGDAADQEHAEARHETWSRSRIGIVVAALALLAMSGAMVEDAGSTWAAVYLSSEVGAAVEVAASAYIALIAAQTIGRFSGDWAVDRLGPRTVARFGGLLIAAGLGTALLFPSVVGTIAGFALAGLGSATLIPTAMHEADRIPGLRPGTGLTVLAWLMRAGFLLSPPLVGLIAEATTIRIGLAVVPVAGALAILFAVALPGRQRRG